MYIQDLFIACACVLCTYKICSLFVSHVLRHISIVVLFAFHFVTNSTIVNRFNIGEITIFNDSLYILRFNPQDSRNIKIPYKTYAIVKVNTRTL